MKMRTHRPLAALLLGALLLTSCAPAAEERGDLDTAGIKELSFEELQPPAMSELKIGVLYSGNEDLPGDTAALFRGTRESAEALGLTDRAIDACTFWRADVAEDGELGLADINGLIDFILNN